MTRVALRGIRAHLGRFLLSILAVTLGVALVAGTYALRAMMDRTFTAIVESSVVSDVYLVGAERGDDVQMTEWDGGRTRFPMTVLENISQIDGVAAAMPDLSGPIVLVGADGTAVGGGSQGPPSFGMAWFPEETAVWVERGHAPHGPDQIGIETTALERSGLELGDITTIVVAGEIREVEVVSEIGFASAVAGAVMVSLDVDSAIAAYAPDGTIAQASLYAAGGLSESALASRVEAALPGISDTAGIDVLTGEQMRENSREMWSTALGFISTFLLVFAGIALFVGAFIISNTFAMAVRQRQREFAMLRAVGASPLQVFGSVLAQAAVVGLLGAGVGIGAGVGLVALLRRVFAGMGMELSGEIPIDRATITVSLVVGIVVSLSAAVFPARKAALTAPVEAMRDEVPHHDRASRLRTILGVTLLGSGIALLGVATWREEGLYLGIGAAATVLSVLLLAPTVVPTVLGALALPVARAIRPLGGLARGNVTRNPRRTASTAGALMIGMALVGSASVIAASAEASMRDFVGNQSNTDLVIQSATWDVPARLVADIGQVDGVAVVDPLRVAGTVQVGDEFVGVASAPDRFFETSVEVPLVAGSPDALAAGQAVIQEEASEYHGWQLGDVLTVSGRAGTERVTVGAVIDSAMLGVGIMLPESVYDSVIDAAGSRIDTVFLKFDPGADPVAVTAEITDLASPYVVVSVMDSEEFMDSLAGQLDQILVILYALLGLSIVIAILGIVNTLALSISERTREIGLLRAVGLGRLQLASVVTIESVLTAVFGTVLGIGVGVGIAALMPSVFAEQGFTTLAIPWAPLGTLLGLAVVVGAAAAVWPAIRAARMDVLDAIAYE